ncbi:YoaK family protein [Finegoldia dalianensis]|uniref:YoaK family protein n=1 Tax=Finegoldia dalianensis TaxID=3145239 RepID=A0ABW9KBD4_9FIRM
MTQKSESLQIMFILTLIGGFLDSYSYVTRGGVFAFAQTGNLVLLSINICYGNLDKIVRYVMPIIAFILGTTLVRIFEKKHKYMKIVHWRQVIIVFEGIILALVGFIPENLNKLACLLISFVCAMQIEAFRRFNGVDLMTTMCTGNLKKATDRFIDYLYTKDNNLLKASFTTYSAILIFILGCIIGTLTSIVYSTKSILILPVIILIAFIIMHETERNK